MSCSNLPYYVTMKTGIKELLRKESTRSMLLSKNMNGREPAATPRCASTQSRDFGDLSSQALGRRLGVSPAGSPRQ